MVTSLAFGLTARHDNGTRGSRSRTDQRVIVSPALPQERFPLDRTPSGRWHGGDRAVPVLPRPARTIAVPHPEPTTMHRLAVFTLVLVLPSLSRAAAPPANPPTSKWTIDDVVLAESAGDLRL